jgi:hypothetical protein
MKVGEPPSASRFPAAAPNGQSAADHDPATANEMAVPRERLESLAAVVLLAGSVRPSELQRAAGRPLMDLPIAANRSLGTEWARVVSEFRDAIGRSTLPLLVTANSASGTPRDIAALTHTTVRTDTEEPRGSGGSLRDIAAELPRDAFLLVASGHSLPRTSLLPVLVRMSRPDDDIVIHTNAESHPTGIFLIRCEAVAGLPVKGFVDLKEQAFPQLASRYRVRIARDPSPSPIAIRSLHGYISALRVVAAGPNPMSEATFEDWMCTFTITEDGASVDPSARLHDSVVLRGGQVNSRASVVRSLVGPEGVVASGDEVFDDLLPRNEVRK